MRQRVYGLLNLGWTIAYFIYWATVYGTLLGLTTGTAIFPLIGSVCGAICGGVIGFICGAVVGIGVALVHSLTFSHDTDLVQYRRTLLRGVGGVVFSLGLISLFMVIGAGIVNEWWPYEWAFVLGVSGSITVWGSLSLAYAASYYPDQIVRRLIHQNHMPEDLLDSLEEPTATDRIEQFLNILHPRWMHWVAIALGFFGTLAILILNKTLPTSNLVKLGSDLVGGTVLALLGFYTFATYCALGNTLTLIFLKRVLIKNVFPDVSPHWARVGLTLVSFILTLLMTWWTLIFALLCALYVAYNAYHTLATSSYSLEKDKRKEKHAAAA